MRKKIQIKEKIKESITFDRAYDEFVLDCKIRNLREATIKHYDDIVNHIWLKFIDYKTPVAEINKDTTNQFILFCRDNMNEKDITINTNIRAMRTILYFFMRKEYLEEFKISEIKIDKTPIETYSDEELIILLKKPNLKECNFIDYRNWTIINFLLATGCRVSTLVNLKIKDLDLYNDLIYYSHTKNRKEQVVPISKSLKGILVEYIERRRGEKDEYLFPNAYGEKMTCDRVSHGIVEYNRKRGINKTGVHRLRHTFAKNWILNGGDIFRLQKILGHSSMEIVRNYVEMFTDDLKKDFDSFNPLEKFNVKKTSIKLR